MMTDTPLIKTRFAPSPTGLMHLGNARTALFNALFAYHQQGHFVLRIEDTDAERSQSIYSQQLRDDLRWLGLTWQEGPEVGGPHAPYEQSARNAIYAKYYAQLEAQNLAYPCFCTPQELEISRKLQRAAGQAPRYAGTCAHLSPSDIQKKLAQNLQPTLRFRMRRGEKIEFTDVVKGKQTFLSDDIGDFIIRRADGTPAFFFCNAIDDAVMGITHVFRGEDHLTNTPRQMNILQALQLPVPTYGHFSIILGHDGKPLSKRNGSQSIKDLRDSGWLSDAVVNYLARLGHKYSQDEYLTAAERIAGFDLARLSSAPARFDEKQLKHWQQQAITRSSDTELWTWMGNKVHEQVPSEYQAGFMAAVKPNVAFPEDAQHWAQLLFSNDWTPANEAQSVISEAGSDFFQHALSALDTSQGDYKALVQHLKQATGIKGKKLFMPLRAALTGETHGPEMANLLPLMGLERARQRLQSCI